VNQASRDVQGESQEPKHHENYDDRPKHCSLFQLNEHPGRLESYWVLMRVSN
jgi:hypothetical protein